jgi:PAS domain S-box-containing protein
MKGFLSLLLGLLVVLLALVGLRQAGELAELRAATEGLQRDRALKLASLARQLFHSQGLDPLEPYPLYEFAQGLGLRQALVLSPQGQVLNDTLRATPPEGFPPWLGEAFLRQALQGGMAYGVFPHQGMLLEAVAFPYQGNAVVLVLPGRRLPRPLLSQEGFFLLLTLALLLLVLSYGAFRFLRSYRRAMESPSETAFMAESFHAMLRQLKEKEAQLQALRQRAEDLSENILESVPSGVLSVDASLRITKLNSRAEELLELTRAEALGRPAPEVLQEPLARLLQEHESLHRQELPYRSPSGRRLWLGLSISPLRDAQGQPLGRTLVFTDLTELRALQEQAELRRRLWSLGEMAAGMAHELRNPLGVIAGYAQMLRGKLSPPLGQAAEAIQKEVQAMQGLINDFLSFARPQRPALAPTPLKELLGEVLRASVLRRQDIEVLFQAPRDLTVQADAAQLRRALANVISNALEAMPRGGRLSVSLSEAHGWASIRVSDTGPGIAPEALQRIFLPFFSTKDGGTGLGLAIAHSILQQHGGSIRVLSTGPEGSTFELRLPSGPQEAHHPQEEEGHKTQ